MHFINALPKSRRGFFFKKNVIKESPENMRNIVPVAFYYMPKDRKFNFEYRIALYWLITWSKVCQYLRI
jgi:hypothetical protein